ncbi:Anaphase-promoting complex subunit 4-like WD40 domain-containing protein [Entamoeba marina]
MNRGVLDGGIEVKGTSIGSDGFDIYIGGNEVVCCDIRTYKRKWDLTIQGNLTIGGGLGIVNGKNCVGFDLNGKVLWKTPRKNVSCLSMCSDGEFCVAGSLSGGVNIITATTGIDLVLLQSIHDGGVTALTWDEKMCSLVTGGEDGIVMNWSCDNVEENIKDSDEWD